MSHRNTTYSVVGLTLRKLLISISLKRRKMKRSVTFFVLTLIATVIAGDDESLEELAKKLNTNVMALQACLDKEGLKKEDISTWMRKWEDLGNAKENNKDLIEKLKQILTEYKSFSACLLEQKGMMVDNKLDADKIIETMKQESSENKVPQPSDEYFKKLRECIESINGNSQMTREDRASNFILCLLSAYSPA